MHTCRLLSATTSTSSSTNWSPSQSDSPPHHTGLPSSLLPAYLLPCTPARPHCNGGVHLTPRPPSALSSLHAESSSLVWRHHYGWSVVSSRSSWSKWTVQGDRDWYDPATNVCYQPYTAIRSTPLPSHITPAWLLVTSYDLSRIDLCRWMCRRLLTCRSAASHLNTQVKWVKTLNVRSNFIFRQYTKQVGQLSQTNRAAASITLMHHQCHFGKAKSSSCSSTDIVELRLRCIMPGFQHYVSGVPEPFCRYSKQEMLPNHTWRAWL